MPAPVSVTSIRSTSESIGMDTSSASAAESGTTAAPLVADPLRDVPEGQLYLDPIRPNINPVSDLIDFCFAAGWVFPSSDAVDGKADWGGGAFNAGGGAMAPAEAASEDMGCVLIRIVTRPPLGVNLSALETRLRIT